MIARALRFGALVGGGLALAGTAACNNAVAPPHGSPVLTAVYWISGDTSGPAWVPPTDPNPSILTSAPPFVDEIDFVFDRRLDGSLIEETFTEGGVSMTRPKGPSPVTVTWLPTEAPADPSFKFSVRYNSLGRYGAGSSYAFLRPDVPGVPTDAHVTFTLDVTRFASEYGEAVILPKDRPLTVKTSALTLAVSAPTTAVGGTFRLPLVFSNRLPPPVDTSPFIHVRAGGVDLPYKLLPDAALSSRWFIAPADCLGRWPANATIDVQVEPGVHDAFGAALALGASVTFVTGPGPAATPDCGAPTDASTSDAAALTDAAADAAAMTDAADTADGATSDTADGGVGASDGGAGDASDAASDAAAAPDASDAPTAS